MMVVLIPSELVAEDVSVTLLMEFPSELSVVTVSESPQFSFRIFL